MPPVIVKGITMELGVAYENEDVIKYKTLFNCIIKYTQESTDAEILADLQRQAQFLPQCWSDPGVRISSARDLTCAHCCQPLFGEKHIEGFDTLHRCSIEHTLINTEDGELLFQSGD